VSDKYLTEKEWKSFSKNLAFKDAPLLKALAAVEKAEHGGADEQIEALDELDKQSELLLKAHKADKALANYLADMDKAASKQRKEAEKALEQAAAAEDEEAGSALLDPKRLLAQLTLCRRDPERNVQFGFVDGKDKEPAVLALSPKVSGRKLFALLQAETGVKTGAYGTAWVDGTSLMLQLDKPLSGLVKKVRAPVKACGFKIAKAVLWNADGTVFEQDEQGEQEGQEEEAVATDAPQPLVNADELAFNARLKALLPLIVAAAQSPAGQQAKLLASEAGMFARKKDYAQANGLMAQAEALLSATSPPGAAPLAQPQAKPGGANVAFMQSRLAWDKTRKLVQAELRKVEAAILDGCKDEPDFAIIAGNSKLIHMPLKVLDERLIDKLDELLVAPTAEERQALQAEAGKIVDEYASYVKTDKTLQMIADNGFVEVAIMSALNACLAVLTKQLKAAPTA